MNSIPRKDQFGPESFLDAFESSGEPIDWSVFDALMAADLEALRSGAEESVVVLADADLEAFDEDRIGYDESRGEL